MPQNTIYIYRCCVRLCFAWCVSVCVKIGGNLRKARCLESVLFCIVAIGNSQMIVVVHLSAGMNRKYLFAFVSHFLSDWMSKIFESKVAIHTLTSKIYSLVYSSLTWFFAFSFVDDVYTPQNIRKRNEDEKRQKKVVWVRNCRDRCTRV